MSGLALAHAELLKVGPISSRHSLRLLPLSKKKKKVAKPMGGRLAFQALTLSALCPQQKFVIGDEYGSLSSFQMKKGEPQVRFCDSPLRL